MPLFGTGSGLVRHQAIPLPARIPADSDRIIDFFVRRATAGIGFRWAMIETTTARFVGAIGFNQLSPVAEIAYHLAPAAWGCGYAREALDEALRWAAETGAATVEAWIDPANHRSVRLVLGAGFMRTAKVNDGAVRFVNRTRTGGRSTAPPQPLS